MPKRGQRPKIAKLKLIAGGASGRIIPTKFEPKPEGEVKKPKLGKEASKVWDQYAKELIRLGTLTYLDVDLFHQYCNLVAFLRTCSPEKQTSGRLTQLRHLSGIFGIGASERARIGLDLARQDNLQNGRKETSDAKRKREESGAPANDQSSQSVAKRYFKD